MVVGSVIEEGFHFAPLTRINDAAKEKGPVLLIGPLALVDTSGKVVDVSFPALLFVSRHECLCNALPLSVPVALREF